MLLIVFVGWEWIELLFLVVGVWFVVFVVEVLW